jgi:peptidoglycan/LPS O-acetylase OafA/YrhL
MLLLIPYHGLVFLQVRDDQLPGLDFSVYWLHLWRMGLFFAVSGFLAAMTLMLWGPSKQAVRRLKRIGIPLLVAMLTVAPVMNLISFWFRSGGRAEFGLPGFGDALSSFSWEPLHLWFLSYLLVLNLIAALAWASLARISDLVTVAERWFRRLLDSVFLIPVLAVASAVPLMLGGFETSPSDVADSLVPLPSALAYYGVFFAFGLMLWRCRDRLGAVEGRPWWRLALAVPTSVLAYLLWADRIPLPPEVPVRFTVLLVGALATWSTLFAVWGAFARLLSGARPWVRYLADASYWIYLIHLPVLMVVQRSLVQSDMPPGLRLVITVSATTGIALLSYALLVRHTRIGSLLHGPRNRQAAGAPGAGGVWKVRTRRGQATTSIPAVGLAARAEDG